MAENKFQHLAGAKIPWVAAIAAIVVFSVVSARLLASFGTRYGYVAVAIGFGLFVSLLAALASPRRIIACLDGLAFGFFVGLVYMESYVAAGRARADLSVGLIQAMCFATIGIAIGTLVGTFRLVRRRCRPQPSRAPKTQPPDEEDLPEEEPEHRSGVDAILVFAAAAPAAVLAYSMYSGFRQDRVNLYFTVALAVFVALIAFILTTRSVFSWFTGVAVGFFLAIAGLAIFSFMPLGRTFSYGFTTAAFFIVFGIIVGAMAESIDLLHQAFHRTLASGDLAASAKK